MKDEDKKNVSGDETKCSIGIWLVVLSFAMFGAASGADDYIGVWFMIGAAMFAVGMMMMLKYKPQTRQNIRKSNADPLAAYERQRERRQEKAGTKKIVTGGIVGGIVAGPAGAVVGALVGKNKADNQKK